MKQTCHLVVIFVVVIVSWDRRGGVSLISNFILILSPALPTLDWSGRDNSKKGITMVYFFDSLFSI